MAENNQYAGFGVRFVAFLIDAIILSVINLIVGYIIGMLMGGSSNLIANVLSFAVAIGYWVFYQSYAGQTVGKKVMNLKVVNVSDGNKPSQTTFFLREIIGKFISALILGIGYLMIIWDPKKQALHDKLAKTYVVKVK